MKNQFILLILILLSGVSTAQNKTQAAQPNQKLLDEYQDMKFGMFVHWGQ